MLQELKPSDLGLQPHPACLLMNWADLPPELLNMIASRLIAKDCFSLVCKSWNDAVASTNSVPTCVMNYCRRTQSWRFHRQDSSSFFTSFPQLKDAEIRCSKYGWLLMARSDNTLFFFNPSSNQKIKLLPKLPGSTTLSFIHPPTSPECIVVGIQIALPFQGVGISILKCGGHKWENQKYPTRTPFMLSHGPPVWHCGQILFLDVKGNVARLCFLNRCLVTSDNCLVGQQDDEIIKEHYLFKLNGEVFGAFVFHGEGKVKVFRLSRRNRRKNIVWKLVEDIGDNVVFLSHESSSLSFRCTADTKYMANRIYFPKFHGDSAVFYSLSDAKYHSLNGVYSDDNDLGLKFLKTAAWVTPAAPVATSEITTEDS